MKIKKLLIYLTCFSSTLAVTSCDKDSSEPGDNDNFTLSQDGVYVLNQGNFYSGIEGSLNVIHFSSSSVDLGVFSHANGRSLGDTPQCGVRYGNKIYVGNYESNTIEIINPTNYRSIKQIKLGENSIPGNQPRSMVSANGHVYISMFDGYVARLDTTNLEINASIQVGPNPEIMAIYNEKLYVPNSDGMNFDGNYGTTACEIDLKTFKVTKTFNVNENPNRFYATEQGLFLLCMGNYYDHPAQLFKINSDYSSTLIDDATLAVVCDEYICYINDPFYGAGIADYKKYNINTGEITDWEIERPEYANDLFYDSKTGKTLIFSLRYDGEWPSYINPGYVAVYNNLGLHERDYGVGSGPACIFGMTK